MESDLDIAFKEAYRKISELEVGVAPDIMLKFYAYYKQANFGNKFSSNDSINLRSGFKFNAWIQLNGMSPEKAKEKYIELANIILNPKK